MTQRLSKFALLSGCLALGLLAAPSPLYAAKKPNLTVVSIKAAKSSVVQGEGFQATAVLANRGKRKAKTSSMAVSLAFDPEAAYGGMRLTKARVNPVPPGGRLTVRTSLTSDDTTIDPMLLVACADDSGAIRESREDDNCTASKNDIEVTAPKGPIDLIDEEVAAGAIPAETGLLYKLYATMGDDRLPPRFAGDLGFEVDAGSVFEEAAQEWSTLSEETRAVLDPFFSPPIYDGAYAPRSAGGKMIGRRGAPSEAVHCIEGGPGSTRTITTTQWESFETDHFRFWHYTEPLGDGNADPESSLETAQELAAVAEDVYEKETTLFGRVPLSDEKQECSGGDGKIDVYAFRRSWSTGAQVVPFPPGAVNRPGYIWAAPDFIDSTQRAKYVMSHEFAHLIHFTYQYAGGRYDFEYGWLEEASAEWAVDFVYPLLNWEHGWAIGYLHGGRAAGARGGPNPGWQAPLGECIWAGCGNGYRDYLFLFYLARSLDPEIIAEIFEWSENADSISALDSAIPGGLAEQFPAFAVHNLNVGTVDDYRGWDALSASLDMADQPRAEIELDGKRKRTTALPGASDLTGTPSRVVEDLEYRWMSFEFPDDDVRAVAFNDTGYRSGAPAGAQVWAYVELENGQSRIEDWTGRNEVLFCRDNPSEDLVEVVTFWVNAEASPYVTSGGSADFPGRNGRVEATDRCTFPDAFAATAEGQISGESVTETWEATIPLKPNYRGPDNASYGATGGTVNWQVSGTVPCPSGGGTRTITGSATWPYYTPAFPGQIGPSNLYLYGPGVPNPDLADGYQFQVVPGPHPGVGVTYGPCNSTPAETTRAYTALNCSLWSSSVRPWHGEYTLSGERTAYRSGLCGPEPGPPHTFSWSIVPG